MVSETFPHTIISTHKNIKGVKGLATHRSCGVPGHPLPLHSYLIPEVILVWLVRSLNGSREGSEGGLEPTLMHLPK